MPREVIPVWLESAGQALAFWIGYQHQRYRHHYLPEGAIVAELSALIYGETSDNFLVHREILYKNISKAGKWMRDIRADLAVTEIATSSQNQENTIVEVKRADKIDEIRMDLVRLSYFKTDNPSAHTFLLIASQNHRPDEWVLQNGEAERGIQQIKVLDKKKEITVNYAVRRSIKAATSFRKREFAHYCVIIEVL